MKKIHLLCLGFILSFTFAHAQYYVIPTEKVSVIMDSLKVEKQKAGPVAIKYWDKVLFQEWTSSEGVHKISLDRKQPLQVFTIQVMRTSSLKREEIVIAGNNLRMSINHEGQISFAYLDGNVAFYMFKKNGKSISMGDISRLEYYIAAAKTYFEERYP